MIKKKSQSQLGVIRRLPSGSHKRRQLRAIACFTNMRCIVVIKEAFEYRLHRLICEMGFFAHTYIIMLKLKGIMLKILARAHECTHIQYTIYNCFSVLHNQLSSYLHVKTSLRAE